MPSRERCAEIRADAYAEDLDITDTMLSWSEAELCTFFESGGTEAPDAQACALPQESVTHAEVTDPALAAFLATINLSHLSSGCLVGQTLKGLGAALSDGGRTTFLSELKALGVAALKDRQTLTNELNRVVRDGRFEDFAPDVDSIGTPRTPFPPIAPIATPLPPRSLADFNQHQDVVMSGDTYGFEFPYSVEMLLDARRFGAPWLTRAFQASGAISAENSVEIVSAVEFSGGGAASKALLTVRYVRPDEPRPEGPLQTELFVKMPHGQPRKREKYLCACIYAQDGPEVLFAQRFAARVPVRAPRTYFAERCDRSTNFIIISERLPYATEAEHPRGVADRAGDEGALPPFRLQRAHSKFHDHHLGAEPRECECLPSLQHARA